MRSPATVIQEGLSARYDRNAPHRMEDVHVRMMTLTAALLVALASLLNAQETTYPYGIHDHEPNPQEWLNRVSNGGAKSWITATFAIGRNPNDMGGADLRAFSDQGHTIIGRLNHGYGTSGTIPPPEYYADFAQRCANFVANSQGINIWHIGNETNLASEWPMVNGYRNYISPQQAAACFRLCYDAIKAVRPDAKILSMPMAPWAGPYGAGADHDGMPLNWVTYLNQMLTAIITSTPGPHGTGPDGIALHINSRGYTYNDIHSPNKVDAGGQMLYFSFYVYKDWINLGIPQSLWHLPLYATECNGNYYWKGGHPECTDTNNPSCSYQPGWMQEIYAEINRWNTIDAPATGKPRFRCINMYRWCNGCDGWNIDGSPVKGQMLADLDDAVAQQYQWGEPVCISNASFTTGTPGGDNLSLIAADAQADSVHNNDVATWGPQKALDGIVSVASKWASPNTPPPHWLAVDLGREMTVNGFILRLPGAAGETTDYNARAFSFQRADAMSGPWTDDICVTNTTGSNVVARTYTTPQVLRYIRLHITDPGLTDDHARIPEFEIRGLVPDAVGDFDGDGDVDLDDYALFQRCLTLPGATFTDPACAPADLNSDTHIDSSDFTLFLNCMSGPGIPPPAACQ